MAGTHEEQVTLTLRVPDGWEATEEYRCPKMGEWFLLDGEAATAEDSGYTAGPILRRVLPDTLTVDNLPRSFVEFRAGKTALGVSIKDADAIDVACLAALKAEGQS